MRLSTYKTCTMCRVEKPYAEFHKHKRAKDGLYCYCKSCSREYSKKWREGKEEYTREYYKKWYEQNSEIRRKYQEKYYQDNKDRIREYHQANPHIERRKSQRRRARKKGATVDLTDNERLALQILTEECILLGPGWHLDHIVPLSKGGKHHPDNLQIVRASYNQSKYDKVFNTRKYY